MLCGTTVEFPGLLPGQSKLALRGTRGDMRVRVGVHLRIDADGDRRDCAELPGDDRRAFQFLRGLNVQAADPCLQCPGDLCLPFADPGEYHLSCIATGTQHPGQLATGHDVEARTQPGHDLQHAQTGIGLDGEAHQMGTIEGRIKVTPALFQQGPGIHIGRRAIVAGQCLQR